MKRARTVLVAATGACFVLALWIAWALSHDARGDGQVPGSTPVVAHSDDVSGTAVSSELEPASAEPRSAGAARVEPQPAARVARVPKRDVDEAARVAALPGKLRVHVVDEHGRALEGLAGKIQLARIPVRGQPFDAGPYMHEASIPADGMLVLEHLALGTWSVAVDARDRDAGASIELTADAPERDVDVVLVPWRVLRVKLCEPNGAPFVAALEREFPGHSVMLELELSDPNESSLAPATDPEPRGLGNRFRGKRGELFESEIARMLSGAERVAASEVLRFLTVDAATSDEAPWRTLSVNSFGALAIDVRFGKAVVAHGDVAAGAQDVTLIALLDSFRDVLRTLHVTIVDDATERPLAGVSVRLRWQSVETTPPRFTDGNGAVAFESQLPRKVAVDVVPLDYDSASEECEIAADADSSVTVRVRRPGVKPVEARGVGPDGRTFPRH